MTFRFSDVRAREVLDSQGRPTLDVLVRVGDATGRARVPSDAEIYSALRQRLRDSAYSTGLGDEGGFAPEISRPEEACQLLVDAVSAAGYDASNSGIAVALDPAANGFAVTENTYRVAGSILTTDDLLDLYAELTELLPIWSIEDGLSEDDLDGWKELTRRLGDRVQIVGDDLLVTDPRRIESAAEEGLATAALIKLNQIGTVTETYEALDVCRVSGGAR